MAVQVYSGPFLCILSAERRSSVPTGFLHRRRTRAEIRSSAFVLTSESSPSSTELISRKTCASIGSLHFSLTSARRIVQYITVQLRMFQMETQSHTLLKYLLQSVESSNYEVAKALDISPASLSRHAGGLLSKPSTLRRATKFFNDLLPDDAMVDADLLVGTPISARDLVRLARAVRAEVAKGSK
jgi:hypothetical protein